MDTTEEYCKMCNCPEIQGEWFQTKSEGDYFKLISGDRCWYEDSGIELYPGEIHIFIDIIDLPENAAVLWLPRQDQLQEMLGDMDKCLELLYWWKEVPGQIGDFLYDDDDMFTTMEQLWLAFVMSNLHQKKWTGEAWEFGLLNVRIRVRTKDKGE